MRSRKRVLAVTVAVGAALTFANVPAQAGTADGGQCKPNNRSDTYACPFVFNAGAGHGGATVYSEREGVHYCNGQWAGAPKPGHNAC